MTISTAQQERTSTALGQVFEVDVDGPTSSSAKPVGLLGESTYFASSDYSSAELAAQHAIESCSNPKLGASVTWNGQGLDVRDVGGNLIEETSVAIPVRFDQELDFLQRVYEWDVAQEPFDVPDVADRQINGLYAIFEPSEGAIAGTGHLEAYGVFDYIGLDIIVKVWDRRDLDQRESAEQILRWPEASDIKECFNELVARVPAI